MRMVFEVDSCDNMSKIGVGANFLLPELMHCNNARTRSAHMGCLHVLCLVATGVHLLILEGTLTQGSISQM